MAFDVTDRETDRAFLSDNHTYDACSKEGISFLVQCNWYGNMTGDSYAHYFYAEDMNKIIEERIKDKFDEFYIVRDCWQYDSDKSFVEFVNENDSASFDAYLNSAHEVTVTFRVYLRKNIKAGQLIRALDSLKLGKIDYSVYFLSVTDDVYDMVTKSGLKCYYPYSKVSETLLAHTDTLTDADVEKIIASPSDVTVGQYIPKYNKVEVSFGKNITREYFRNLDPDTGHKDIVEEIGPYGIVGSGILRFTWPINDGSKASLMFNSDDKIISIYIKDKDGTEVVYERY